MSGPLDGIRVLDLSRLLPAPFATMILADMGADVIRVESPGRGDRLRLMPPYVNGVSASFITINRNKRSVAINLKDPRGLALFFELAKTADVVIEGYMPGTVDKLGVGYDAVRAVKPDIIYCSMSGYGQTGPYRDRPGHDINYMGIGAAVDLMTDPGVKPRIPGVFLGDLSGSLYAVIGMLAALVHRQQTGQGQYIDVGMVDGLLGMHTFLAARYLIGGLPAEHGTTGVTDAGPTYQIYETGDGEFITFAPLETRFWHEFCQTIGRDDLRARQWDSNAVPELEVIFKQRSRDEWMALSAEHDFCLEPVLSLDECLSHPQVTARGMVVEADHPVAGRVKLVAPPILFGEGRGEMRLPAPAVGEHTVEILREAGVDPERVEQLLTDGVLATTEPTQRDAGS